MKLHAENAKIPARQSVKICVTTPMKNGTVLLEDLNTGEVFWDSDFTKQEMDKSPPTLQMKGTPKERSPKIRFELHKSLCKRDLDETTLIQQNELNSYGTTRVWNT